MAKEKLDKQKMEKLDHALKQSQKAAAMATKFTAKLEKAITDAQADGEITPEEQEKIDDMTKIAEKWAAEAEPEVQPV